MAAVIVFAASLAGTSHPGQRWVVAIRSLGPGAVLEPGDLTTSTMRLSPATAALAYRQAASVEGRALAVGLRAGELLQDSMLVPSSQKPVAASGEPGGRPGVAGGPVSGAAGRRADDAGHRQRGGRHSRRPGCDPLRRRDIELEPAGARYSGQVSLGVSTLSEVEAIVAAAHTGTVTLVAAEPSDGRVLAGAPRTSDRRSQ